jgi:hypothetical protein
VLTLAGAGGVVAVVVVRRIAVLISGGALRCLHAGSIKMGALPI